MKKTLGIVAVCLFSIFALCSCAFGKSNEPNVIPEQNVKYTHFQFGNVIDEGKRAVYLNFDSDYSVSKLEIAGTFKDSKGKVVHSFDTKMSFGTASENPKMIVMVDKDLISRISSVSFTKIKAYTTEQINS